MQFKRSGTSCAGRIPPGVWRGTRAVLRRPRTFARKAAAAVTPPRLARPAAGFFPGFFLPFRPAALQRPHQAPDCRWRSFLQALSWPAGSALSVRVPALRSWKNVPYPSQGRHAPPGRGAWAALGKRGKVAYAARNTSLYKTGATHMPTMRSRQDACTNARDSPCKRTGFPPRPVRRRAAFGRARPVTGRACTQQALPPQCAGSGKSARTGFPAGWQPGSAAAGAVAVQDKGAAPCSGCGNRGDAAHSLCRSGNPACPAVPPAFRPSETARRRRSPLHVYRS